MRVCCAWPTSYHGDSRAPRGTGGAVDTGPQAVGRGSLTRTGACCRSAGRGCSSDHHDAIRAHWSDGQAVGHRSRDRAGRRPRHWCSASERGGGFHSKEARRSDRPRRRTWAHHSRDHARSGRGRATAPALRESIRSDFFHLACGARPHPSRSRPLWRRHTPRFDVYCRRVRTRPAPRPSTANSVSR